MKFIKLISVTTIVLVALAALGVTLVFAQQPTPTNTPWWNTMLNMMRGTGMMGGNGNWQSMQEMHNQMSQNGGMGAMHGWMHQSGGVHESVWRAIAEQLGMTPKELTAEINSGKTLGQIAQEKGVSTKDLAATMENQMKAGLAQAVEDGKLTQEQADLMLKNMEGQYDWMINNMDAGMMGTGSGMMGPGRMGPGGCHNNRPDTDDTDNTSL